MAAPAAAMMAKAALAIASDKRGRTAIASVIAAVLTPLLLVILVIMSALSGTASHNKAAVDLTFHGGYLSAQLPADYRAYIETMRNSFAGLDTALAKINAMSEGGAVDADQVKAIFYALFFGAAQSQLGHQDYRRFADCFVTYEQREDADGKAYTVAIPISDLELVYANLAALPGQRITAEDKSNARRIYSLAKHGLLSPTNDLPLGAAMGDGSYAALIAEAEQYLGYPYVFGGSTPQTSFDCSGFICWVYTQSGVYPLPRTTAYGIYNQCAVVSREDAKPGDLIFFANTYACAEPVSHIGIYVGGGQMLHCGSPIQYTSIDASYWQAHFYAFGRLPS